MNQELKKKITNLREDFTYGKLDDEEVPDVPFELFCLWLEEAVAKNVPEVQAMVLSTVSREGLPSSRIVYLREFEKDSFYFYGNFESRKARELEQNPNACLLFFWPLMERQIRMEGIVGKAPEEKSDNYFSLRPRASQIGSWASNQSSVISGRKELEKRVEELTQHFRGKEIPRPPFWGGWILKARYYEFWQGRKSRLHDRIAYRLENNQWKCFRLSP